MRHASEWPRRPDGKRAGYQKLKKRLLGIPLEQPNALSLATVTEATLIRSFS
ncbi:MAG: hypothetical protein ABI967_05995 [bacterium]